MALTQAWNTLSDSLLARNDALPSVIGTNITRSQGGWHALFSERQRPLLVPVRNRAAQRTSLRFFLSDSSKLLYAKTALTAHHWIRRARLPQVSLPDVPTLIDKLAVSEAPQAAFLIGTPGPYQKASMLLMSHQGEPQVFVKIAMHASADHLIGHEAKWLRKLGGSPLFTDHVPALLRHGVAENGRNYLVTTVAQGRPTSASLTHRHGQFLRSLATLRYHYRAWPDSAMAIYLRQSLEALTPSLTTSLKEKLTAAIDDCSEWMRSWQGTYVAAHGDFAPWNIRKHDRGIAVFDWEYAVGGAVPLFDVLHFMIAPRIAASKRVGPKEWKTALSRAQAYAKPIFPESAWTASDVAAQGLVYLLYTVCFYSMSRNAVLESHPTIDAYLKLIEERAQWRAWSN